MRQAKAGVLDVVEEGEAGSQGVDVNPEQFCGLELAARLGERIDELIDGDEPLGGFTCDVGLDVRRLAGAVPALEVDEFTVCSTVSQMEVPSVHPRTVGGRELVGQTSVLGWAESRVLQGRCVRAPQSVWDMLVKEGEGPEETGQVNRWAYLASARPELG